MAALAANILRGETSPEHLDEVLSRGPEIANMSFRDPLGRLLVHISSACGDVRALRWLLQHGADIRATTIPNEDTVLHLAASEGHVDTVTYLLEEACIGISGVNAAGESALDVAMNNGFDEIVRVITRHIRPPPPTARQTSNADASENTEDKSRSCPPSFREVQSSKQHSSSPQERLSSTPHETTFHASDSIQEMQPHAGKSASTASAGRPVKHGPRTAPFEGRGVTSGGFFIAGAWSKAGIRSCFNVRHAHLLEKHGIVFDMGICPSEVVNVQHVFVTHGHLDHCGAIVSHARIRSLVGLTTAKYFMHGELAEGMKRVRQAFEAVEGGAIPMEIVSVGPDNSVDLGRGCFVRPFLVQHRVKALGFSLIRRKTGGLKQEFRELDGKTLGDLKKRGVEISTYREIVEVVYTGDTVMSPLLSLPQLWRANMLIMEVSYLDGDGTAAAKTDHIHVQDLLDNIDKFEGVEQLVVMHVSDRYAPYQNVLRLLAAALPQSIVRKVSVALGEFGAPGHLTFLEDYVR